MNNFKIFDTTIFNKDISEMLKKGNEIFKEIYIDKSNILNGLEVSFSPTRIDSYGLFEKFKHLASIGLDESGRKYDIFPCINDINNCIQDCSKNFKNDFTEGKKQRMFCPFRASRIFWTSKIFELYSENDPRIKLIIKEETREGRFTKTVKLWFHENKIDYVVILHQKHNKYLYITSYPIVMNSLKDSLSKEHKEYVKSFENKKAGVHG